MMNILGFVAAILIIFSIVCSFMFKEHHDTAQISKSIKGYYAAEFKSKNAIEKELYKKATKDQNAKKDKTKSINFPNDKVKKTPKPKKEKSNKNPKDKSKKIYDCTCINIYPLITNSNDNTYEILANLIRILYKNEKSDSKLEYKIINSVIAACKEEKEKNKDICLEKLALKDPSLHIEWYKMLKGTRYYDFDKKIGSPSILEFITCYHEQKKHKICLEKAPKEILSALFNEKIADKILYKKSQDKKNKIRDIDIPAILKESNFNDNLDILSMIVINHQNHKGPKFLICKDENTQISIKRSCNQ